MKYINIIVMIFIIFISQFMINTETSFQAGIIIISTGVIMMILNSLEYLKVDKENEKEKLMKSGGIIFTWFILVVVGGALISISLNYADLMLKLKELTK